jgi:hypothetical protein
MNSEPMWPFDGDDDEADPSPWEPPIPPKDTEKHVKNVCGRGGDYPLRWCCIGV